MKSKIQVICSSVVSVQSVHRLQRYRPSKMAMEIRKCFLFSFQYCSWSRDPWLYFSSGGRIHTLLVCQEWNPISDPQRDRHVLKPLYQICSTSAIFDFFNVELSNCAQKALFFPELSFFGQWHINNNKTPSDGKFTSSSYSVQQYSHMQVIIILTEFCIHTSWITIIAMHRYDWKFLIHTTLETTLEVGAALTASCSSPEMHDLEINSRQFRWKPTGAERLG